MSDIKKNLPTIFELVNACEDAKDNPPTLLLSAGIWKTEKGDKSGISISAFGEFDPLVEPQDARRLAKWLLAAADDLSGEKKQKERKNNKKPRYDDEDDRYSY